MYPPIVLKMKSSSPSPRRSVAAFTLIELLTVIAIIGILAAILIPTVSAVREKAKSVKCVSRLRQWGGAIMAYAAENRGNYWATRADGNLPWCISSTSGTNPNVYGPYFKDVTGNLKQWILCPSKMPANENYSDAERQEVLAGANTPNYAGYVMIWPTLNGTKASDPLKIPLNRATAPSRTILMIERVYSGTGAPYTGADVGTGATFSRDDISKMGVYANFDRHNKRIHTLFMDGSVRGMVWSGTPGSSLSSSSGLLGGFDGDWLRLDR